MSLGVIAVLAGLAGGARFCWRLEDMDKMNHWDGIILFMSYVVFGLGLYVLLISK